MFVSSNLVNYRSKGWGVGKFSAFWEQGISNLGKWFAEYIIDLFFFQLVFIWFPGDCGFLKIDYLFYLVDFGSFVDFFFQFVGDSMNCQRNHLLAMKFLIFLLHSVIFPLSLDISFCFV